MGIKVLLLAEKKKSGKGEAQSSLDVREQDQLSGERVVVELRGRSQKHSSGVVNPRGGGAPLEGKSTQEEKDSKLGLHNARD